MWRSLLAGLWGLTLLASPQVVFAEDAVTSSGTPAPAPPHQPVRKKPEWAAIPSLSDMEKHYPLMAQRLHMSGRAVLHCVITVDGVLANCTADSETPAGSGFAEAALGIAPLFRLRPETVDGEPVGGAFITIPIRFTPR